MAEALERIDRGREALGATVNGWSLARDLGRWGTDYDKRAAVACFGLGANLPADAVYARAAVDSDGRALDGVHRYVVHFAPGRTPPVRAFWSLTMYDERQYLVDNAAGRCVLGDRDALVRNEDGLLDLALQHDSPGASREANWLPAPAGPFNVVLRMYWPRDEVLDGRWSPPPIERLAD